VAAEVLADLEALAAVGLAVLEAAAAVAAAPAADFKKRVKKEKKGVSNMLSRMPKKPAEIFSEIANDFKKIFGSDLLSIILYGSGATQDYIPGRSDINFLVVLSEKGIEKLQQVPDTVHRWKKRNVATPLFITKSFIAGSLDSYPIEFLNMKRNHALVFGEDVFSALSFDAPHIRLQLERELKGKILNLQTRFIETEGKAKRVKELIRVSIVAFVSLFYALLHLKGLEIPQGKRDVIKLAAETCAIDGEVFLTCLDIKEGINHVSSSDIQAVFNAYLKEIYKLNHFVDGMKI
jgi:hypothetical protein